MKRLIALVVALSLAFTFPATTGFANDDDKVTICHQAGPSQFVTITVDRNALKGHFNENGTPREGHTGDYFGECKATEKPVGSPTAAPTAKVSPTPTSPVSSPTVAPRASQAPSTANPGVRTLPSTSTK